jgi:phospholipid/cholesterol/gamma-HCH transport system substrate-binding protein
VGITGIMFMELERAAPGERVSLPKLDFEPNYPVIPTKPSELQQLFTDLYAIMNEIKQVDFKQIADNVSATLDNVNRTLTDAQVREISVKIQKTLAAAEELIAPEKWQPIRENIQQASHNMNRLIDKTDHSVDQATNAMAGYDREIAKSINEFQTALNNAATMIESGAELINDTNRRMTQFHQQLNISLRHLENVSVNLNRLIEDLVDQPSQLLFSPPPPPAKETD